MQFYKFVLHFMIAHIYGYTDVTILILIFLNLAKM